MMHQLLHENTSFLFALLGASVAAIAVALLLERLAERTNAAARHALILAALLAPPVLFTAGAIGLRVPMPATPPAGGAQVEIAVAVQQTAAASESELPCAIALVWLAGAVFSLMRIAADARRWRGVAARAEVITHQLFDAPYTLAQSVETGEPAVIGIVDPMVLLPSGYDLPREEMQAVFAHELAHIARRDNLTALIVQIVCALFWFDPLHRLARRRLVELRERVCDDLVLSRGCDPAAYVAALARSCESSLAAPAVACMSRLKLQERMESIMTHHTRRRWPLAIIRAFVAAAVTAAAIGFATFAPALHLTAAETPAASAYDFDVRVMPRGDGRFTLNVRINSPDGNFTSVAEVRSAPDTRTVSTTYAGKTYNVEVHLAVDGAATAKFEVREGETLLVSGGRVFPPPPGPVKLPELPGGVKRLGDDPNVKAPKPISRVEPIYTAEAKEARVAGIVILETLIKEDGTVGDVRVLKPLPYGLDQAAVEAVRQWRFEPATIDGKPVPVIFNLTMNFRLD